MRSDLSRRQISASSRIAELHAAERGVEGRQAAADRQRRRHDAARRDARHIDDLGALQDRAGAGFAEPLAQLFHQRQRAVDPVLRREIGEAEFEDARRQRERAAVLHDIAERGQRAQHAPRGRARQIGDARPPPTGSWSAAAARTRRAPRGPWRASS